MTVLISWFIPGGQAQDKRSMDIDQGTYVQFINVNNKIPYKADIAKNPQP
jgi:hypothetical protein